ncbi:MAG: Crp/Fnr family transcriptional regulator [Vulcanimicrobiaceae bacterium]
MISPSLAPRTLDARKTSFGNAILDAVPPAELRWIVPEIRRVFLRRDQQLIVPGQRHQAMLFPIDALVWSWAHCASSPRPMPISFFGRRGVIGLRAALDSPESDVQVSTLSPGTAWRLPLAVFERECQSANSGLRKLLTRLAYAHMVVGAMQIHCNAEHNVDQRLARWLLTLFDEAGRVELNLTHQRLAEIASVRRPSVSLVFAAFQRDRLITSHHGQLTLLDRNGLLERSCNCYRAIFMRLSSVVDSTDS